MVENQRGGEKEKQALFYGVLETMELSGATWIFKGAFPGGFSIGGIRAGRQGLDTTS